MKSRILLHCHYSGIVRNSRILAYLLKNENIDLSENGEVYFSKSSRMTRQKKLFLKKRIKQIYSSINENRFEKIGKLWYFVIKSSNFFEKYNRLIIQEMEEQNINYIEFRIRLGTYFCDRTKKRLGIESELDFFYNFRTHYLEKKKDFKIICQISKNLDKKKVYEYFSEILSVLKKKPYLKKIISGFDIVGDEESGNSLWYYEKKIKALKQKMTECNIIIPFYFHAGEIDSQKSVNNIRFALKYGGNRIAHGIYCIRDPFLMNIIKKKNILLEIAPISNYLLGNLKNPYLYKSLYENGIKMCVNTDDPNKLNDTTILDNHQFLLMHGFTKKMLQRMNTETKDFS